MAISEADFEAVIAGQAPWEGKPQGEQAPGTPATTAAEAPPASPAPAAAQESAPAPAAAEPAAQPAAEPTPSPAPAAAEPPKTDRSIPLNRHQAILNEQRHAADERIKQLQAELDKRPATTQTAATIDALEALKSKDYPPELLDAITAAITGEVSKRDQQLAKLTEDLNRANQLLAAQQDVEMQALVAEEQAALKATPALAQWQNEAMAENAAPEARERYEAAMREDARLAALPGWADKPLAERFRAVEQRIAQDYGIQLQATPAPTAPATPAAAAPAARPTAPSSLSTIPAAAVSPAVDPHLDGLPLLALDKATRNMTPQQLEKALLLTPG